ncbi:heme exporter protein CcmD [uncultured Methylibium sp.]|uniref:heme exporter protein CcmD n=1 Tax=uncultured Methylibium sp. TaxID=381093 RepID=UPI0025D4058C|nr:heme exporter protein CcmD [uncultured Methylibium sp.]
MNWSSVSDFLAMGGYGLYVWGSFGMVALAIAIEVWQLFSRRAAQKRMTDTELGGSDA